MLDKRPTERSGRASPWRWLWRIVIGCFALIGFSVVAIVGLAVWFGSSVLTLAVKDVPDPAVIEFDLTGPLAPPGSDDSLAEFFAPTRLSLRRAEEALDRAARDARVRGVVLRLGGPSLGLATTQELRDAVANLRKAGKFVLAFAESYGGQGSGSGAYYLATSCEEIWLQPSGDVGLAGVVAETPFLKGSLDKLGVTPRFDRRKEYKSAVEQFTEAAYSPAFRESMNSILGSIYDQLVAGVAGGRALSVASVKELIERGPFLAREALAAKLVDRLGYLDEVRESAKRRAGPGAHFISLREYRRDVEASDPSGPVIALIEGSGPIVSGESALGQPFSPARIGADTIVEALDEASNSRDVKAILLRVDSPGGSYIASDTIWRAVMRAKAAGKPVIVSMGNVAASGGYFISAPATKIVAEPGTLTGSIGVFGGKFVLSGLLGKLGVTTDSISLGDNAGMWSPMRDFTPPEWAKLESWLDAVYGDFTTKVAEARGLGEARIPEVAKGRVFTGLQAQKIGLVDALGGLPRAIEVAREVADVQGNAAVRLRTYPRGSRRYRRLLGSLLSETGGGEAKLAATLARGLGESIASLRPLVAELPALLSSGESWLLMPPVEIR